MVEITGAAFLKLIRGEPVIETTYSERNTETPLILYGNPSIGPPDGKILISSKNVKEEVLIKNLNRFDHDLIIDNCTFQKTVSFENCTFRSITIRGGEFREKLRFYQVRAPSTIFETGHRRHLDISYGRFERLSISGSNENLEINSVAFGNLIVDGPMNPKVTITGLGSRKAGNQINFTRKFIHIDTYIFGVVANAISFSGIVKKDGHVKMESCQARVLLIRELTNLGEITIQNNRIDDQIIPDEKILNSEYLRDLETDLAFHSSLDPENSEITDAALKKAGLIIRNAKLQKIRLQQLVMNNCEIISIRNTDLTEIIFIDSPLPVNLFSGKSSYLYEVFNQLYTAARRLNNKREEKNYYAASRRHLLKSKFTNEWYFSIPSIISLTISYLYSNFGLNWIRAFFITILISSIFFSIMILSSSHDLSFTKEGYQQFWNLKVYFFHYLNPTHKLNFMDHLVEIPYSQRAGFVLFDLMGRIFIGIGVYEIIRSFRKYAGR